MRTTLRLLVLALVVGPGLAPADKKTDESLSEIQRDVAALAEQVKALQKAQDDKIDTLKQSMQQAVAASNQVAQDMAALQRNLTTSVAATLNEQQSKIAGAVAPLGTQMDTLSKNVEELKALITQMNTHLVTMNTKLQDVSDKVSILNQPVAAPPAAVVAPTDPNAPPPGVGNKLDLWQKAQNDYANNNDDAALKEYANYIKYFRDDENGPMAGYMIGMTYLVHLKDYDAAVDAFQHVIDTWPSNNRSQDALYQKARALGSGGHKTESIAAYREFIKSFPANEQYWAMAKKELDRLTAQPAKQAPKGRGVVKQ
jgi:TolA-binding protein